jgi:hypothetical protein
LFQDQISFLLPRYCPSNPLYFDNLLSGSSEAPVVEGGAYVSERVTEQEGVTLFQDQVSFLLQTSLLSFKPSVF